VVFCSGCFAYRFIYFVVVICVLWGLFMWAYIWLGWVVFHLIVGVVCTMVVVVGVGGFKLSRLLLAFVIFIGCIYVDVSATWFCFHVGALCVVLLCFVGLTCCGVRLPLCCIVFVFCGGCVVVM